MNVYHALVITGQTIELVSQLISKETIPKHTGRPKTTKQAHQTQPKYSQTF